MEPNSGARDAILQSHAQELANFDATERRNVQATAEWHAWRGPFIVRAALMFNVECKDVTAAQYAAAVERTAQETVPSIGRPTPVQKGH